MFNRSRSSSDGGPPTGGPDSADATGSDGSEAARAFDRVLSELKPPSAAPSDTDASSVAASATEHAETLRATRDAHQEAQQMLAMATDARKAASEEAERIVLEARDAAERTRQELSGWAAAQRAKVDALASDMVASANRDADAIRAEALRTSMAEAEETAAAYVADAAERARRDAEEIRGDARGVLTRAVELGDEVTGAIDDLSSRVADIVTRLQDAREAMGRLLAENRPPDGEADQPDQGAVGEDDEQAPDDAAGPDDQVDEPDGDAGDDGDTDTETDAGDDRDDEDPDEDAVEDAGADELPDRQLGSMFRRRGARSE